MVLKVNRNEHNVVTLTLNRPDKLNALSIELVLALNDEFSKIKNDPTVRGIVLTGEGRAFTAGGDVEGMLNRLGKALDVKSRLLNGLYRLSDLIRSINRPVVAAINGICFGAGFVLSTACDITYASDKAKFGFAYGNVGLIPEGAYFISRYAGLQRAKQLVFSRAIIDANQAREYGFVLEVYPEEELMEKVYNQMNEWANGPIETIGLSKDILNGAFENRLADEQLIEAITQGIAFTTAEHKEGVNAFIEKRKPNWKEL
ncbi:MAG: enoyl-CoA hydratase-related protein [Candidatus Heimdallarchaeota archaeon]|nr:enoyl-CoA hydratase-related protein [Candidatus Heimdallarchaeota archaeon]MDH5644640.1 enoyl-CoA hydratase-related protein [Candidatus Heimdallarchaeota archaeon]